MSKKNIKVKDVLLDILAFVLALFTTALIFLIYPTRLGVIASIIVVVLSFGLVIDREKMPKPIKAFCNFMAGLCLFAFIGFVIGMYTNSETRIYLGYDNEKTAKIILTLGSVASYIFLYFRAFSHECDREDERREKEKAEKEKAYFQNHRR